MSDFMHTKELQAAVALLDRLYKKDGDTLDLSDTEYWNLLDAIKQDRDAAIAIGTEYLKKAEPYERFFGISLLGEICNPVEEGEEDDAEGIAVSLIALSATETSPLCLGSIADALSKTHSDSAVPTILELSRSKNEDVRWSATVALGVDTEEREDVTNRLLELASDSDEDVRSWALLWLGMREDSPAVRVALLEGLDDTYVEAQTEAVYALAGRGDQRALPPLMEVLSGDKASSKDIEAAGLFGLPELFEYLAGWNDYGFLWEWARKRCDLDEAVRDSVDDEWANDEVYLDVVHGVREPRKYRL
jgi:hypothetical protein